MSRVPEEQEGIHQVFADEDGPPPPAEKTLPPAPASKPKRRVVRKVMRRRDPSQGSFAIEVGSATSIPAPGGAGQSVRSLSCARHH